MSIYNCRGITSGVLSQYRAVKHHMLSIGFNRSSMVIGIPYSYSCSIENTSRKDTTRDTAGVVYCYHEWPKATSDGNSPWLLCHKWCLEWCIFNTARATVRYFYYHWVSIKLNTQHVMLYCCILTQYTTSDAPTVVYWLNTPLVMPLLLDIAKNKCWILKNIQRLSLIETEW